MFIFAAAAVDGGSVGGGGDDGATRAIIENETGYKSKHPIC